MEDQVFSPPPARETSNTKASNSNLIIGFVATVIVAIIATGAYYLGKNSQDNSPAPTIIPTPTVTPTNPPTQTPTATISSQPTISPTTIQSKTSATPTPTPLTTPTPILKSKVLSSSASLDGFRSSNGGGNDSLDIRAGRNSYLVTRGFVSFDLTSIPAGSNIVEATLRLYQAKTIGNPYAVAVGGALKVDHLIYGDSLDSSDYGQAALSASFATLTTNSVVEWKDVNVTNQVKEDVTNARARSQFRIHFTTEETGGTAEGDFAYFESANNSEGTGNTPQLIVKYY
jgi:hypothetical protein